MSHARGITTLSRFFYLNFYAFLLLLAGGGVIGIAMMWPSWPVWGVCGVTAFFCIRGGVRILAAWPDKKRKYAVLMQRNAAGLRPDTFTEFMQAPCGRLLARVVVDDLGQSRRWHELKAVRRPLAARCREECRSDRKRTVVHYINTDKQ